MLGGVHLYEAPVNLSLPWRPDILLTVAGDILPLLPQEDYITPLLSPLISLSNILLIPPLLCPIPLRSSLGYSPSFRPDCSFQSATLKRRRALREGQKHAGGRCPALLGETGGREEGSAQNATSTLM